MTTITLKIEAPELAASITALAAALGAVPAAETSAPATDEGKPKRGARSAAKPSAPDTAPSEPETQVQTDPDTTAAGQAGEPSEKANTASASQTSPTGPSSSENGVTYDQVRQAVLDLTAKRGRDAAVACLGQFENADGNPAANGKELQPADWQDFINAAKALIEGELA